MGSHFHDWVDYNGVAFLMGNSVISRGFKKVRENDKVGITKIAFPQKRERWGL